jgi:dihydroxy-acid dehydratase
VLRLEVSESEVARRLAALTPFQPRVTRGYLKRYAKMVTSADTGAVFADD